MNREELREKIREVLADFWEEHGTITTADNKIMLLIDEYNQTTDDWNMELKSMVAESHSNLDHLKRKGWNEEQIFEELELFVERTYPKQQVQPFQAMRHFFNSINKRKSTTKNEW